MLGDVWDAMQSLIGSDRDSLNALQMALRAILVYGLTIAFIRLGSKRFLGKASAFDVIVAIMLGSIMSGAITGGSPFLPTLVAGGMLVGLHWLLAVLAVHTNWFGSLVKGTRTLLIRDGQIEKDTIKRSGLTPEDLYQAVRQGISETDIAAVQLAYLERDGTISIIPKKRAPQILEIAVDHGVQTVRIEVS